MFYVEYGKLTSKFTTRIVFSRVLFDLFEALVQTHVPHVRERLARERLVHMSS